MNPQIVDNKTCERCYTENVTVYAPPCHERPELLKDAAIGMYHCPDCGAMLLAGMGHGYMCVRCILQVFRRDRRVVKVFRQTAIVTNEFIKYAVVNYQDYLANSITRDLMARGFIVLDKPTVMASPNNDPKADFKNVIIIARCIEDVATISQLQRRGFMDFDSNAGQGYVFFNQPDCWPCFMIDATLGRQPFSVGALPNTDPCGWAMLLVRNL